MSRLWHWLRWLFYQHRVSLTIQITGVAIMLEGATISFKVVAKNASGREVPDANVTVTIDTQGLGTLTFDPGTNTGTFTAGTTDGTVNLTATDGKLTSPPFPVTIAADNTPASLEIQAA